MKIYFLENKKKINHSFLLYLANCIKIGKIIALDTDTVPGLITGINNKKNLNKIYIAKHRNTNKPCSIFVKDLDFVKKITSINDKELQILQKFFPGKLTIVLKLKNSPIYSQLKKWGECIGIRIPNDPLILKLLQIIDFPLFATSLNQSGFSCIHKHDHLSLSMKKIIDIYIYSGPMHQKPSTVIQLKNEKINILREGAVSKCFIENFLV